MKKLALHFGAGNIGRGFIAPVLQENGYDVVFADVNSSLVQQINERQAFSVSHFDREGGDIEVSSVSAVSIEDEKRLRQLIRGADLISTSVGAPYVKSVVQQIALVGVDKECCFVAFENQYRSSTTAQRATDCNIEKLNFIDAVVDKIVPPQANDTLDVIVESYGSIVLDDVGVQPLLASDVVDYADYEKAFTKKLWLLNGLHLQMAYFGIANDLEFIHELFNSAEGTAFCKQCIESLALAYRLYNSQSAPLDDYVKTILKRVAQSQANDALNRVARNPAIKFARGERFQAPLDLLIENNADVSTFKQVMQSFSKPKCRQVDGFDTFDKELGQGLEAFLQEFWNVDDQLDAYLRKLA